jgi:hypothetical protein
MVYPILFVALEVSKALATESLLLFCQDKRLPFPKALVTLLPEIGKAIICLIFLAKLPSLQYCHLFIAHSMLFFLNNSIYINLLQYSEASTIQFWAHIRLPVTAFMHHIFIRKQTKAAPWLSLMMIFIGVVLTQIDDNLKVGSMMVFSVCLLLAVNSATAAIYNELLLKSLNLSIWEQQAWISMLGIVWNAVYLFIELGTVTEYKPLIQLSDKNLFLLNLLFVIALACIVGIIVGFLVKKFDNIVKLVSSAISTVLIGFLSSFFYPDRVNNSRYFEIGATFIVLFTGIYAKLTSVKSFGKSFKYQEVPGNENQETLPFSGSKDSKKIRFMLFMIVILLIIGWITFYLIY